MDPSQGWTWIQVKDGRGSKSRMDVEPSQGWTLNLVKDGRGINSRMDVRVDATHFSFSDPNSPMQGIPKYEIRMPCNVLGQSDHFVPGPHPP